MNPFESILTPAEIGTFLGVSEKTLAQWRSQRKGPSYHKIGGRVRYFRSDIEAWINQHKVNPELPKISLIKGGKQNVVG